MPMLQNAPPQTISLVGIQWSKHVSSRGRLSRSECRTCSSQYYLTQPLSLCPKNRKSYVKPRSLTSKNKKLFLRYEYYKTRESYKTQNAYKKSLKLVKFEKLGKNSKNSVNWEISKKNREKSLNLKNSVSWENSKKSWNISFNWKIRKTL